MLTILIFAVIMKRETKVSPIVWSDLAKLSMQVLM